MVLVLVPTRELAMQVGEAIHRYGRDLGAQVLPIYGGQPISRQLRALERGVDVVVATPGRALDHIRRGTLSLAGLEMVVLDEADEMLDMGFADEIEAILSETPESRQTVLFSATLPHRIDKIARRHLRNPVRIQIASPTAAPGDAPRVRQCAYVVQRSHKPAALGRILDIEAPAAAIVFCRTRDEVDRLTETLNGRGFRAEALHRGMSQEQRDRVISRVRSGSTDLLVATDVAARGLDIDQLTHVVNYDVPASPEAYVHRTGRVGRAGREGVAITLAEPREHRMLQTIERVTKQPITVAKLPTVADLRERRLEATTSALREQLEGAGRAGLGMLGSDVGDGVGSLDSFRVVVESLADEFDVVEVALAAVKLAFEASGGADDEEIPDVSDRVQRENRATRTGGTVRATRSGSDSGYATGSGPGGASRTGGSRDGGSRSDSSRPGRPQSAGMTRLYVGVGRDAGIRPQDLVGAIAGETALSGRQIGAIEIAPRFSLVEVPDASVDEVIAALRATTVKGRRATVRRERNVGRPRS